MPQKPDGWLVNVLPIEPASFAGGERNLVLGGSFTVAILASYIAPRLPGGWEYLAFGLTPVIIAGWIAWLRRLFRIDNRLSQTYPRYRQYPRFIPAHASSARPHGAAEVLRKRSFRR